MSILFPLGHQTMKMIESLSVEQLGQLLEDKKIKRLLVFVLTITLTFCFTACAAIEDASSGESNERGKGNMETIEETKEPETIDYTEVAQQAYDLIEMPSPFVNLG